LRQVTDHLERRGQRARNLPASPDLQRRLPVRPRQRLVGKSERKKKGKKKRK
jgi:hypothetical protein